jgi:hypothetical protein
MEKPQNDLPSAPGWSLCRLHLPVEAQFWQIGLFFAA